MKEEATAGTEQSWLEGIKNGDSEYVIAHKTKSPPERIRKFAIKKGLGNKMSANNKIFIKRLLYSIKKGENIESVLNLYNITISANGVIKYSGPDVENLLKNIEMQKPAEEISIKIPVEEITENKKIQLPQAKEKNNSPDELPQETVEKLTRLYNDACKLSEIAEKMGFTTGEVSELLYKLKLQDAAYAYSVKYKMVVKDLKNKSTAGFLSKKYSIAPERLNEMMKEVNGKKIKITETDQDELENGHLRTIEVQKTVKKRERLNTADFAEIVRLYKEGNEIIRIAKSKNIFVSKVITILRNECNYKCWYENYGSVRYAQVEKQKQFINKRNENIAEFFRQGWKINDLKYEFGLTQKMVTKVLVNSSLMKTDELLKYGRERKLKKSNASRDKKILEEYVSGISLSDLSGSYEITEVHLKRILKKENQRKQEKSP